ncbi:MAG: DNA alkylation repair protein [Acidimicrobiia bacterium]
MDAGAAELILEDLLAAFSAAADPVRAAPMARYMKDRFEFFGIPSPARRSIQRAALARWRPTEPELVAFVDAAWCDEHREVQYAACDLLVRHARRCSADLIRGCERWITHRPWWDTVDAVAPAVGDLVLQHPELTSVTDRWIGADDFWLARVAIIHQLRFKDATDADRLFGYCARRAEDREFFVRKAIGWALRQYARTDPDAVVTFVGEHPELSPLSRREALRRLA